MADEFLMPSPVDRVSIQVLPTQALVDWLNTTPLGEAGMQLDELRTDGTAYLAPYADEKSEVIVQRYFRYIFERELHGWCPDAAHHPEDQSWEAFQRMFDARVDYLVYDLWAEAEE